MNVPGLGEVTQDEDFGWCYSQPVRLSVLGGAECRIVLAGYEEDGDNGDYHRAIAKLMSAPPAVLKEAERYIYEYYLDMRDCYGEGEAQFPRIESANEVWSHVRFGDEPMVSRRRYGDKGIYVSLECSCDWEPEHGLQIVLKDGEGVCKVGPYDGHLTNSDAYDDETLERVIYRRIS